MSVCLNLGQRVCVCLCYFRPKFNKKNRTFAHQQHSEKKIEKLEHESQTKQTNNFKWYNLSQSICITHDHTLHISNEMKTTQNPTTQRPNDCQRLMKQNNKFSSSSFSLMSSICQLLLTFLCTKKSGKYVQFIRTKFTPISANFQWCAKRQEENKLTKFTIFFLSLSLIHYYIQLHYYTYVLLLLSLVLACARMLTFLSAEWEILNFLFGNKRSNDRIKYFLE